MTLAEQFQAIAPQAKLPWDHHPDIPGVILDADGVWVCEVSYQDDGRKTAEMIVLAVNTCGGFKAEIVP